MIVDSTALTEQVVRDVLASAFQSAGQRCSALRLLYVQEEARPRVLEMLDGAMAALTPGDPWDPATDVGPVIDAEAEEGVVSYVASHASAVLASREVPARGRFAPPTVLSVKGAADLEREVFGPVLHVAPFRARDLDRVVDDINARGYGLTFGLHSRIDDRVERVTARVRAGNLYVNRNQIGAVVGSQPFGGEGLSGTGPKAGGPHYLPRLQRVPEPEPTAAPGGPRSTPPPPSPPSTPPPGRRSPTPSPSCAGSSARTPPSTRRRRSPGRRKAFPARPARATASACTPAAASSRSAPPPRTPFPKSSKPSPWATPSSP
jgi:RHH-type proline utilization regulon transcriptional repressor/proline dehydrogenase/delta 1-pyrroline-5-carboxylate dehydrogenase